LAPTPVTPVRVIWWLKSMVATVLPALVPMLRCSRGNLRHRVAGSDDVGVIAGTTGQHIGTAQMMLAENPPMRRAIAQEV